APPAARQERPGPPADWQAAPGLAAWCRASPVDGLRLGVRRRVVESRRVATLWEFKGRAEPVAAADVAGFRVPNPMRRMRLDCALNSGFFSSNVGQGLSAFAGVIHSPRGALDARTLVQFEGRAPKLRRPRTAVNGRTRGVDTSKT